MNQWALPHHTKNAHFFYCQRPVSLSICVFFAYFCSLLGQFITLNIHLPHSTRKSLNFFIVLMLGRDLFMCVCESFWEFTHGLVRALVCSLFSSTCVSSNASKKTNKAFFRIYSFFILLMLLLKGVSHTQPTVLQFRLLYKFTSWYFTHMFTVFDFNTWCEAKFARQLFMEEQLQHQHQMQQLKNVVDRTIFCLPSCATLNLFN